MSKISNFFKSIGESSKNTGIIFVVAYFVLILTLLYNGIITLINPDIFFEDTKSIIKSSEELHLIISILFSLSEITTSLFLLFRLHIKNMLFISMFLFILLAFFNFYNAVDITPSLDIIPQIEITNATKFYGAIINIILFLISAILYSCRMLKKDPELE